MDSGTYLQNESYGKRLKTGLVRGGGSFGEVRGGGETPKETGEE